jgi:biopolymer transport protein ExbD
MAMASATGDSGSMNSDINVTPFIDVLLVLLVIFMITLPLSRRVLDIQVPKEEQSQATQTQSNSIVLEIKADGSLAINTQPVEHANLATRLHEIYDARGDKLLFIKVDNSRRYREVVNAIDIARGAGVQVFGLAPPGAALAGS